MADRWDESRRLINLTADKAYAIYRQPWRLWRNRRLRREIRELVILHEAETQRQSRPGSRPPRVLGVQAPPVARPAEPQP